jgi:hypothetical protein
MHNRPGASDLLLIARQSLMATVLPALPEHLRYQARMVASAMAIAHRELTLPSEAHGLGVLLRRALHSASGTLSPSDTLEDGADFTAADLLRLSMHIRAGEYDQPGEAQQALLAFLREITRARLAVTDPKLLQGATHVQS